MFQGRNTYRNEATAITGTVLIPFELFGRCMQVILLRPCSVILEMCVDLFRLKWSQIHLYALCCKYIEHGMLMLLLINDCICIPSPRDRRLVSSFCSEIVISTRGFPVNSLFILLKIGIKIV